VPYLKVAEKKKTKRGGFVLGPKGTFDVISERRLA